MRFALLLAAGAALIPTSVAYGEVIYGLVRNNELISFNTTTPGSLTFLGAVTGFGAVNEDLVGIDFRPNDGILYGLSSRDRLYSISLSGAPTASVIGSAGSFNLGNSQSGMDFDPVTGKLRFVNQSDKNLLIDVSNGTAVAEGDIDYAPGDSSSGNPRVTGLAYTNNFAGATTSKAYAIDATFDQLTLVASPSNGDLQTVGDLGVTAPAILGFDISGTSCIAYLAFQRREQERLYSVNLATGAATELGIIGPSHRDGGILGLRDISVAPGQGVPPCATGNIDPDPDVDPDPVPEPGMIALFAFGLAGTLAIRRRKRR